MAIQLPDAGTGNGATGDNEFVLWTKVKNNFSNQDHAASRLVGTDSGNVMEVGAFGVGRGTTPSTTEPVHTLPNGFFRYDNDSPETPSGLGRYDTYGIKVNRHALGYGAALFLPYHIYAKGICLRVHANSSYFDHYFYTDRNTTTDANGFIKAASPIVKVFADKVDLNSDAASQDVTFTKNGVGDYTITTQSGLSIDGWYIELPKDINGNPKLAVTLDETDGVISLKCYKRVFSMETFTFVPDLDEPLDVPDGRWIDLRLNEIPNDGTDPDEV